MCKSAYALTGADLRRCGCLPHPSPGAGGLEHSCTPGGGQFLGEVVTFRSVTCSVAALLVVDGVSAALVERDDVVDNVCGGVEVVGDAVIDLAPADTAWWFGTGDCFAMPVSDGGVAACTHSSNDPVL